jgi:TolB-like protein
MPTSLVALGLALALAAVSACGSAHSDSTGFVLVPGPPLPPGIPKRVAVAPFSGDSRIAERAAEQFATGLIRFGFDVVQRRDLEPVLADLDAPHGELLDDRARDDLAHELGIQGLFVGRVSGESGAIDVDTRLTVKLVDLKSGRTVWAADAEDPRRLPLSTDVRRSMVHTVDRALDMLEGDIDGMRLRVGR